MVFTQGPSISTVTATDDVFTVLCLQAKNCQLMSPTVCVRNVGTLSLCCGPLLHVMFLFSYCNYCLDLYLSCVSLPKYLL